VGAEVVRLHVESYERWSWRASSASTPLHFRLATLLIHLFLLIILLSIMNCGEVIHGSQDKQTSSS